MKQTVGLLIALLLLRAPLAAQSPGALSDLSLEELMRIEVGRVFGASQRLQPVTEAPASVTIVTADEIARYGYRSLADILRGVRGLYVSDDRNYSYVGIRGFARGGDYNTRVLLLVNGHKINDNVFDQAGIGADLGIDPDMFERVEIIRGPASALYGTSAFFAVVNVITRSGASLDGVRFAVDGGGLATARGHAAAGRRLPNGADFAVAGTFERSGGVERLYFPAFDAPETNGGVAEGLDGERVGQVYGRFAAGAWTLTGAHGHRAKDVPAASFGTVFNEQHARERTTDRRTLVDALYDSAAFGGRVAARGSFDRYHYDGVYPLPGEAPGDPVLVNYDEAVGTRWGADGRFTREFPARQTLTVGAELFHNVDQDQRNSYDEPSPLAFSLAASSLQGGAFAQDEIRLHRVALVNLGLRYDGYRGASRVTPRAALVVTPTPGESFKYLYGRAFRAPNVHELDYHTNGIRNTALAPESISTHEVVWERYTRTWLRTSAAGYWYRARQLISLREDPTTFDGLGFVNAGEARADGLELEAEVLLEHGVQATGSYAFQRARDGETGAALANSPRHLAKARASLTLAPNRSTASVEWQYASRRLTPAGTIVGGSPVVRASVAGQITRSLEIAATVSNLFDRRYHDPASDEHLQDAIPQNGRVVRVGLRWALPRP